MNVNGHLIEQNQEEKQKAILTVTSPVTAPSDIRVVVGTAGESKTSHVA